MTPLRQRMIEDMRLRNLAAGTITSYVEHVALFARFHGCSPEQLGPDHIRAYQLLLVQEKKVSWSYYNVAVCALRFFYKVTLGKDWIIAHIHHAKQPKKLPVVLSRPEVVRLLECVPELTHRVVLLTIYATGLRISEATRLRIQDIDSPRRLIHVREGKSRRDRVVPLPPLLLDVLRTYWKEVRPVTWLFPGQQGATCIHRQTVTRACKRAARRAGLGKRVTAHTLRHCFATQLLESGADIRTIQELLGHRHLRTTTIYTHVTPELLQITTNPLELLARETPRVLDLARVHGSKSATSSASTEPNTCKATDR